jgi:hypothetical protein
MSSLHRRAPVASVTALVVLGACGGVAQPLSQPSQPIAQGRPNATTTEDKSRPWTTPELSPSEAAARGAEKQEYIKTHPPPPFRPGPLRLGLETSDVSAPLASIVFSASSSWAGRKGDEGLTVYAGSHGRDDPATGAWFAMYLSRSETVPGRCRLQAGAGAGPLHITGVISYARLRLVDDSGKHFLLDATTFPPTVVQTLDGRRPSASAAASSR